MSLASLSAQLRTAFHTLAKDEFSTERGAETLVVAYSDMGLPYADDAVFIGNVAARQEPVTTNRGREVTLTLVVSIQSFRKGDGDPDELAFNGMSELAHRLSERVRRDTPNGDTTLGGVVRTCAEVEYTTESHTVPVESGEGRLWIGEITYEAQARLRG